MKQNSYIGLLDKDTITIKHPQTKKDIKLYRVISLKSFKLDNFDKLGQEKLEFAQKKLLELENSLKNLRNRHEDLKLVHEKSVLQENFQESKEFVKEIDKVLFDIQETENLIVDAQKHVIQCQDSIQSRTIKVHTIGGWVQSLDNLDNEPVWVDHRSRVFDNAKIVSGSLVTESSVIYGNAVIESSRVKHYARIHGNTHVKDSFVLDLSEVKGNAIVEKCTINNSSMIFENAKVFNTILSVGSCIRGNSNVQDSILQDTSQIQGDSTVSNCTLSGRYVIESGNHSNERFYKDDNLKTYYEETE